MSETSERAHLPIPQKVPEVWLEIGEETGWKGGGGVNPSIKYPIDSRAVFEMCLVNCKEIYAIENTYIIYRIFQYFISNFRIEKYMNF